MIQSKLNPCRADELLKQLGYERHAVLEWTVPASGSCGWFHMRPEISTANDVVLTDVSQLFLSGCQQTHSHSECNLNRKF